MIDSTKLIELADADFEMLKELKHKEGEFVLHHNGYFDGFAMGVKIGKTDTINKARGQFRFILGKVCDPLIVDALEEDFRKAMEDEK